LTKGEQCKADALPPKELRSRIEDNILSVLDIDDWNRTADIEKMEMQAIKELSENFQF